MTAAPTRPAGLRILAGVRRSAVAMMVIIVAMAGLLAYLIVWSTFPSWVELLAGILGIGIPLSALAAISYFGERADEILTVLNELLQAGRRGRAPDLADEFAAYLRDHEEP